MAGCRIDGQDRWLYLNRRAAARALASALSGPALPYLFACSCTTHCTASDLVAATPLPPPRTGASASSRLGCYPSAPSGSPMPRLRHAVRCVALTKVTAWVTALSPLLRVHLHYVSFIEAVTSFAAESTDEQMMSTTHLDQGQCRATPFDPRSHEASFSHNVCLDSNCLIV